MGAAQCVVQYLVAVVRPCAPPGRNHARTERWAPALARAATCALASSSDQTCSAAVRPRAIIPLLLSLHAVGSLGSTTVRSSFGRWGFVELTEMRTRSLSKVRKVRLPAVSVSSFLSNVNGFRCSRLLV